MPRFNINDILEAIYVCSIIFFMMVTVLVKRFIPEVYLTLSGKIIKSDELEWAEYVLNLAMISMALVGSLTYVYLSTKNYKLFSLYDMAGSVMTSLIILILLAILYLLGNYVYSSFTFDMYIFAIILLSCIILHFIIKWRIKNMKKQTNYDSNV